MEGKDSGVVLRKLVDYVSEISSISGFRCVVRKQCRDLSRRVKLLMPLLEEFLEIRDQISEETLNGLILLKVALESAVELLKMCNRGSSVLLVLQSEKTRNKFQELTGQFEEALSSISYEKLDIPDELKEQVELIHDQFRKAKDRIEAPDLHLYVDLLSLYNQSSDMNTEPGLLHVLCEKLELMNIGHFKDESLSLDEMIASSGSNLEQSQEKLSVLMKKLEACLRAKNPNISIHICENCSGGDQACANQSPKSPVMPDDFRCPISLELMKDPVIICTGQTYERASIKRWIEAGHGTCPKTQQKLFSTSLTPNYALSSVITHWCETNGLEPPKRFGISRPSACSVEGVDIDSLLSKLTSGNIEEQRASAGELRVLARNNGNNRMFIAEAGAIPLLVGLLSTPDTITQEHAITALLNLSICEEDNKRSIVSCQAVPEILHVLKNGSMEARENAAATIFSLAVLDEYKVTIGAMGAIPVLVALLREGSQRGKKDAAAALFSLCIFQGNKVRAIRAGLVPLLMSLLTEPHSEMVDEALAIVAMLASHSEGKVAIGSFEAVPLFVELIRSGSPKSKENATAVLVYLCADHRHLSEAQGLDVVNPLLDLAENGTDRGRRKAVQLLQILSKRTEPQLEQARAQIDGQTQAQTELPTWSFHFPAIASLFDS